jgi:nitroimidazol reductase NimA-like FMN-containing flavoprotein (pyridoxamine 5'-phosphate oxidase superfamily)
MEEHESLEKLLRDLLNTQRLGVLATHNPKGPHTSLVAFAATYDLKNLLFATTRSTRKYANLVVNTRVAMLVDNRSNDVSDFRKAVAITATGKAREVPEHLKEEFLTVYLNKHPYLRDFVAAPTCALLRIEVDKYSVVNRFQNVVEWRMTP